MDRNNVVELLVWRKDPETGKPVAIKIQEDLDRRASSYGGTIAFS